MSSKGQRRSTLSYDRKTKRFRDAQGRFVSRERGLKSKYARATYLRVIRKGKAPAKPKPRPPRKPVSPKKPTPRKKKRVTKRVKKRPYPPLVTVRFLEKLPEYGSGPIDVRGVLVTNQIRIFGISRWNINTLANLLYKQIKQGYARFRFWYKIVKTGFVYTETTKSGSKIGSTTSIMWSHITYNKTLPEIVEFLQGARGWINGRVIYYWISKR